MDILLLQLYDFLKQVNRRRSDSTLEELPVRTWVSQTVYVRETFTFSLLATSSPRVFGLF